MRSLTAVVSLFLLIACAGPAPQMPDVEVERSSSDGAVGTRGMVSTAHPLATEAGLAILEKGGNAFDAAVAVASTLNVVEPMMSGMGGYGTILVFDAEVGEAHYLDASGKIPMAVDSDVYRPPTPGWEENRRNAKAVSTPGALNAWEAMSTRFGTTPWRELLEPAIAVAEEGFVLDERGARFIEMAFAEFPEYARAIYGKNGQPLEAGDRLIQTDLAGSLRQVSEEGAAAIYGGSIGGAIDSAMAEAGGFLSFEDLVADRAEWWEPIRIDFEGYEVVTPSAPAGAFPMLVRLGMMSLEDLEQMGHNSFEYLHHFAEVTKRAYWMRLAYSGDPDFEPPPYEMLLSPAYWEEESERIDPDRAWQFEFDGTAPEESRNTTHFVVADRWGNVVSATVTLGNLFGSRIMAEGTGIWLNNSLAYCTFEPEGNPMDAHPGRRKLSSDAPSFVLSGARPWIAVGTPGGHTITQAVAQMILNAVVFDMGIQEAIDAPRIAWVESGALLVEPGIARSIRDRLAELGHEISARTIGNAHAVSIEYDGDGRPVRFVGASDSRGTGLARGF